MDISLLDAGILAGTGYGVVFAGLIVLMIVIILVGKAFSAKKKEKAVEEKAEPIQEVVPVQEEPAVPVAPGSAGQLKLYDTPPKTAAMLMAIVADQMGKPLNELRFISIKEVK